MDQPDPITIPIDGPNPSPESQQRDISEVMDDGDHPMQWVRSRSPLAQLVSQGALPNVEQVKEDDQPLISARPDFLRATQELLDRIEGSLMPTALDRPDHHSAIPMRLEQFYLGMEIARRALGPGPHRFLDVGSGLGTKCALAHALGWEAHGVEIHEPYVEVARKLYPHCRFKTVDANEYDGYGKADLVYAYKPMVDTEAQARLNETISDQLKPGAVFFSASHSGPYPTWLDHVAWLVWRKP